MKVRLEGSRILASLEDEGKDLVIEVDVSLRYADGRILPVLVFGKTHEGSEQAVASVQRRLVRLLGPVHVAPWGRKAFPLSLGEGEQESGANSFGRMKALPKLPRL